MSATFWGYAGWAVLTFAAAAVGALASVEAAPFYASLVRPAWAPPASVFDPVWTVLYALMAIAAGLVWSTRGVRPVAAVLRLFVVQLVLNAVWSWLFFKWHQGLWAFVDIVLLWALLVATAIGFWRARPVAGLLLIPYFLWVSFASMLNLAVWRLNPALLG